MSLRVLFGATCVLVLILFAWSPGWRSWRPGWFYSTCGAVMMMAVLEHPDMPRSIGVPGINFWNILAFNNLFAWLSARKSTGLSWDIPAPVQKRVLLYCGVMFLAFLRILLFEGAHAKHQGFNAFAAYFINCFKWLIPAVILFDGCRSQKQARDALFLILTTFVLVALQTIKIMPLSYMSSGDEMARRSAKLLLKNLGYHRVDVSMMLAGGAWAIACCAQLFSNKSLRLAIFGIAAFTLIGQALTAGRMGYIAFGLIGVIFAVFKWRQLFVIGPIALLILVTVVPAARERMLMGFASEQQGVKIAQSTEEITSGRVFIWPLTIDKIKEKPLFGWGRDGFHLSRLDEISISELGEAWPHPHNAYLEYILDTGVIGMLLTIPIFATMVLCSFQLLRQPDPLPSAVGGATLSLWLALLFAAMGAQTFYLRESSLMMWALGGIMMRVWVECDNRGRGHDTGFFV